MSKYVFGVDIGGTTVKLGLFTDDGTLREKWEIKTTAVEGDNTAILMDVNRAIQAKITEKGMDKADVLGIGMGVPGPVLADGTVNKCINLKWGVFNVVQTMQSITGFKVKAGNDANVAALGEQFRGGGQGYRNIIMTTLGTGVGSGVILDGRIIPGAFGAAGETGHFAVCDDEPEVCGCGKRGCLEQYASANGVVRLGKRAVEANSKAASPLPTKLGSQCEVNSVNIFRLAQEGDALALQVAERYFDILGKGLSYMSCVIDPDAHVLGGGVSNVGQYLVDGVTKAFRKHCFHASTNAKIMVAKLGNDAGIYGCCAMILGD